MAQQRESYGQGVEPIAPILSLKKRSQGHFFQQLHGLDFTQDFARDLMRDLMRDLTGNLTLSAIPLRLRVEAQGLGYYSAIALKLSAQGQVPLEKVFSILSQSLTVPPCVPNGKSSQVLTALPGQSLGWLWDYGQMAEWLRALIPVLGALPGSFTSTITAPVPWGFVQYAQGRCAAMGRLLPRLEAPPVVREEPLLLPDPLRSLFKTFVSALDDWETRPSVTLTNLALTLSQAILTFEAQAWPYRSPNTASALVSWQSLLLENCQTVLGIWLAQAGMTTEQEGARMGLF